jgi:hypothetical protein
MAWKQCCTVVRKYYIGTVGAGRCSVWHIRNLRRWVDTGDMPRRRSLLFTIRRLLADVLTLATFALSSRARQGAENLFLRKQLAVYQERHGKPRRPDSATESSRSGHLVSWAGRCPRLDESAGKRRSTRTRRSAAWLKTTRWSARPGAATRKKDSYLRSQFLRIKSRGAKKAFHAVANSMLSAAT